MGARQSTYRTRDLTQAIVGIRRAGLGIGRVDAELRAVLADYGVFPEFITTEFERVMKVVFAPLGSDAEG